LRSIVRSRRLLAGEREQPAGQFAAARQPALRRLEQPAQPRQFDAALRRRLGHVFDQLEIALDDGQQIVEIMHDPAGQAAHRFHLAALP
jgi:hypothetical protein